MLLHPSRKVEGGLYSQCPVCYGLYPVLRNYDNIVIVPSHTFESTHVECRGSESKKTAVWTLKRDIDGKLRLKVPPEYPEVKEDA